MRRDVGACAVEVVESLDEVSYELLVYEALRY